MNDIFGLPMAGIMVVLLALLGLCLLSVAYVALRRPVIFRLGVRNIPRRKAQTILIVVGLMLSTLIISAALGTGDTLDYSLSADAYDNLGHVDELVVASLGGEAKSDLIATGTFGAASLDAVENAVAGNPDIDGLLPMLEARVAVVDEGTSLAEPDVVFVGLDPASLDAFGGLRDTDGQAIDLSAIDADGVVVSETLAEDLNASVGDRVTVYHENQPATLTVAAIAEDSYLSGTRRGRETDLEVPGMAIGLAALQDLTGQPGQLSAIAVSNQGGVRDSLEATDGVVATLQSALTGQGLGIDPIKQDRVDRGESIAAIFTSVFLVLGLFSVSAGVLLIVLIFTMLASERRSEMGMARAVGAQRRHLSQQFVSEGTGYAILAGLVGAALGVGATYGIAYGMKAIFGEFVPVEPHVEPRSMVVAYCLGMVITFLTVAAASWKISRLNIVAAIRDIPDVRNPKRKRSTLVWAALLLAAGGLLTLMGQGSGTQVLFMTGLSLLPFGFALILWFFGAPGRPVFTTAGLALLVFWLLPEDAFTSIFGDYDGDIEMFFVSGIFMVVAATLITVNNLDVLLAGVGKLGGLFKSKLPAVRTAIAYPGAAKGRTGLTIAMFSLIVFSLVMMATMSTNFSALSLGEEASAGWDVRGDSHGAAPIPDFAAALAARGVETAEFQAIGVTHNPSGASSEVRVVGDEDTSWKRYPIFGMDQGFIEHSELSFGQRAVGYDSDAAIVEALRTRSDVAVVDVRAVPAGGLGGGEDDAFTLTDLSADDKTFDPIPVELVDPRDGSVHTLTVIGVLDEEIGTLYGLYAPEAAVTTIYGPPTTTSYYVALDDPDRADAVAKSIEAALLTNGVQGVAIDDELEDAQRQENGFLSIIQGFMGLGLLVGVAAVGVIAFRSVIERRQQIGVLRALGFQRGLVTLSFLIETTFTVGLGGFAGTALGLVLARNLFLSDDVGSSDVTFLVPWGIIAVIAVATNAMALLMTCIPAWQAGLVAPAEALRYE